MRSVVLCAVCLLCSCGSGGGTNGGPTSPPSSLALVLSDTITLSGPLPRTIADDATVSVTVDGEACELTDDRWSASVAFSGSEQTYVVRCDVNGIPVVREMTVSANVNNRAP